ncbi:probable inactive DNA (cytosine-5)-methyltransferase DRM3 isoform X3 [Diospyros lotus]|uniref:probable inactive DNA (cytosine-5)-methyltransferase DRM3 isoform X3 n=1 Tax=Diospyros lotus TaxID=55363 RepID=UPI002254FCF0|nr:probable inactive DNA (cytosine-5)-methyltransferase DRM3 isoform X3 [Diospyros lotus]
MPDFERTVPKIEISGLELPPESITPRHMGDNAASSSGSNLRSSFIGMGFSPSVVDKVIEEKGEADVDLLLETLLAYSVSELGCLALEKPQSDSSESVDVLFSDTKDETAVDSYAKEELQKPYSESSDSLDSLFGDDKDANCSPNILGLEPPKEDPEVLSEVIDNSRTSLIRMNFSLEEINFAIDKLGEDAPISELVDFIFAAQIAKDQGPDTRHADEERNEETCTESLFGTMDKTLHLLKVGFSENQISAAIEKCGTDAPISELADSICADEIIGTCNYKNKNCMTSFVEVKTEDFTPGRDSQYRDFDLDRYKGKRPKEEYIDGLSSFKKPKQEYDEYSSSALDPSWLQARKRESLIPIPRRVIGHKGGREGGFVSPQLSKPMSCRSVDQAVAKPPYFFYGNVINLSQDCWTKISQFMYALEPEFVNTHYFSALSRKEGYVHNLPSENRFHILPKPSMTIEEAIPHTKRWWPSWDSRKQLSCISSDITGISQLCDRLGKILNDYKGLLSVEKQRDVLHQCRTLNLLWVGHHKLGPVEPEHLEQILGYPLQHTHASGFGLKERLESLKHSFQTDTLGYHLSVLKFLFPEGLTVLSIYSGIGGAEISLHRLGIHLKGVVSVEPCETKRKILSRWWQSSGQIGELEQVEDIQRLTSNKLDSLIKKFGGFDFIICQNPYAYSPNFAADGNSLCGLDFTMFYEFVRVLQRVRSKMERSG